MATSHTQTNERDDQLPYITSWREHQQAAWTALRCSRASRQGIYYWIPRRTGGWRLSIWLAPSNDADELKHLHHRILWAQTMEHVSHEWGIDVDRVRNALVAHYAGVPRGRVAVSPKKLWVIGRGTETIVPHEVERICRVFRLDGNLVRVIEHDHWDPLPSDVAAIEELIGKGR